MNRNPLEAVASLRVRNVRTRFLSDEEEDILLKACGPAIKPVVIAALHTGLRRTEIATLMERCGPSAADCPGTPRVSKSAIGREVPRDRTVYALLSELQPTTSRTPDLVFKKRFGLAFKRLSTLFSLLIKRTELSEIRFHDLRHTFAGW